MRKILYFLINKLGYRIENKNKHKAILAMPLKKYNIIKDYDLLFQSKFYIGRLEQKFKDLTIVNHKGGFLVSFLDLKIYVESVEEFHILNEIFVSNDYDVTSSSKAIVIDIGANIGIASLFFSRLDFVESVFAFEPIKDSFEQALYNLQINSKIHKVEFLKNIGLGGNSRKDVFLFDRAFKGNTGIRGELSPNYANNNLALQREVQIEDATIEIENIINVRSNYRVIVKMDCEGGEYEILENLYSSGSIKRIDILLLEWHDKGSATIEEILIKSGFDFFSRKMSEKTGMIYAFKK